MKIRRLQLESQQMARLSVQAQLAGISIDAPMRRIKAVQQQRAQMTVNREYPSIQVNMERLRNNLGMKSIAAFTQDVASQSLEQAKQNIKINENNGDYITASLPRKGNPIAELARSALLRQRPAPAAGGVLDPTVDVKSNTGSFSIDWSLQDLSIIWDEYQAPVITIEPKPSVEFILAQKPQLEFKVIEQSYPPETGRTIDKEV